MGAVGGGLDQGLYHLGVGMAQQQGRRTHAIVDVFVAIHVPLAGSLSSSNGDREGLRHIAVVSGASRGEEFLELGV